VICIVQLRWHECIISGKSETIEFDGDSIVAFNKFQSIRYKFLLATLALILMFTFLTMYLWYSTTYENAEDMSLAYVNELVRVSTDNFEVVLRDANTIISSVVTNKGNIISVYSKKMTDYDSNGALLEDNRKVENYIQGLYSYKQYISGLMVTGLEGRSFTYGVVPSLEKLKAQSWYVDLINKEGNTVVIPPHELSLDNEAITDSDNIDYSKMAISIAKPILDISNNYVIGFAIVDIKGEILQDIFNFNLEKYGELMIIDKHSGNFIYKPELDKFPAEFSDGEIRSMFNNLDSSKGHIYAEIADQEVLVIYSTSPFTGWTTVALIPKDRLLTEFYKTRNTNIVFSILFCLIAAILTYLIASILTTNILKLNRAMKNIDKDSFQIAVTIKNNDEIGQLYKQFEKMVARIKDLIHDIKKSEKDKRKSEIKALQAQINPHFLNNTLNTISYLAEIQGTSNIRKISESLSILMHINMQEESFITIADELKYLESYLNIQNYKYVNKFTTDFSVEESAKSCMILKLLLQPIVENAIIHGVAPQKRHGIITIKIFRDQDNLIIRIRDNGAGMSGNRIEKILNSQVESDSIGIRNIISRIKLHFGEPYGLSISSEPNVYTVIEITIPAIASHEVERYA
jgi:two-component system, sensor histidine kinase YesM